MAVKNPSPTDTASTMQHMGAVGATGRPSICIRPPWSLHRRGGRESRVASSTMGRARVLSRS